jgi:predicted enzyme involved in methoxymalonyl-ACP biosynthesis
MNFLKSDLVKRLGCSRINAEFVPTARNAPASLYLKEQGFDLLERRKDGAELYEASGPALQLRPCEHIRVAGDPGIA